MNIILVQHAGIKGNNTEVSQLITPKIKYILYCVKQITTGTPLCMSEK